MICRVELDFRRENVWMGDCQTRPKYARLPNLANMQDKFVFCVVYIYT